MMNDITLSEIDKDWVKMFEFRIDDILKNDYCNSNNINYRFDFNELCKSIGLDSTILNKEGTLMYALWVTLLNGIRKYKLLTSFKYPTIELFLTNYDYYDKFKHENEIEIKKLWYIANWMSYLFTMVSAKKNKGLAMIVIPKLIEGWNIKYITGSGQTRATTNRVHIFECEGNVKANHRGKVKKLKMLEDDNTNEAASLLLSQIKNHEKHLKPKKRKITKTKTNNTINNNHHYNNFDNDYNHQLHIQQQQLQQHNNVVVNNNNNEDEINYNYNSTQYFQTNEFDLLGYNSSTNLTTLPENKINNDILNNINSNNNNSNKKKIKTKNIKNNTINKKNIIIINNDNNNDHNNNININIDNNHNVNNNSGTKRTYDITTVDNNENYNFNEWKEQTENYGLGLLALSRNNSYTADLQREFSWLDSSALDLINSVTGDSNIIDYNRDNNIVNNDDIMNMNSRSDKNGDIDVSLIDIAQNYIPVDDLLDGENNHDDDTDIVDENILMSQPSSLLLQPFKDENTKKQYSPFEINNNFTTTTTTLYTNLNNHNFQKKLNKKKELKQGCLFPVDELPRLPSHPFRMSSECWADIPIIPGEPIVPIKDVDSWRKSVKIPTSTSEATAACTLKKQQQQHHQQQHQLQQLQQQQLQQQQQKMLHSAASNNINKVHLTGFPVNTNKAVAAAAGMNFAHPFQANGNTTATIIHGNNVYNSTTNYTYNNNINHINHHHHHQHLNTIENVSSSVALDVPLVADASLPVFERLPSDFETFTGGMNYTTTSAASNNNDDNSSSSSSSSSSNTVQSISPHKQVSSKVRSSLLSSVPSLGPSSLTAASSSSAMIMNSNYINNNYNNATKHSLATTDVLESTAGVLHCEALLSLFNGYH